ncbi:MAG TPA: hypothetical protein VFD06_16165, partial [Candidatus Polarisedimenticolia bacterium]|nr:hypothetical protein [Candidatus Polarisedimenticolia bacterium]
MKTLRAWIAMGYRWVTVAGVAGAPVMVVIAAAVLSIAPASAAPGRSLTFEERVAAQKAIEQVYWNHRIWPKENPGRKPSLSEVLPDSTIRARVDDYLLKSSALEKLWQHPITPAQLQNELNRMAADTRAPEILRELFAALGNDPHLIAETLARQTLADRLVRNWYANDERFHGKLKGKAEAALAACLEVGCMRSLGGDYRETTWRLRSGRDEAPANDPRHGMVRLDAGEWQSHLDGLVARLGGAPGSLPALRLSGLEETPEAFVVTAVLGQGKEEVRTATVTWRKTSFDDWWKLGRKALVARIEDNSRFFTLPVISSSGCTADTWSLTSNAIPSARIGHTAVWTGTEMIIWGGSLDIGGRYDPASETWKPTSTGANLPQVRREHTAVWTG